MASENKESKVKEPERLSREEFNKLRTERKVSLAQERESRVIIVRTDDTRTLVDLQPPLDKAIKRLRDGMGNNPKYPNRLVCDIIDESHDLLVDVYRFAEKVSKLADVPFRAPRRFVPYKVDEDVPDSKTELDPPTPPAVIIAEKGKATSSKKAAA